MNKSTRFIILCSALIAPLTGGIAAASRPLSLSASTGLGYDSNAFVSPDAPYTDYYIDYLTGGAGASAIDPQVQSGFFANLGLDADYALSHEEDNPLVFSYSFDGDLYLDDSLSNANEYKHGLRLGRDTRFDDSSLDVGVTLDFARRIYYDRDTGDLKRTTLSGSDISDRYSYNAMGVEAQWDKRIGRNDYRLSGAYESRDYAVATPVTQLDHTRLELGGRGEFRFGGHNKLKAGYSYTGYDYSARKALSIVDALPSATLRSYVDHDIDLSLLLRQGGQLRYYVDYDLRFRRDDFEGYHDYDQNRIKLRVLHNGHTIDSKLSLSYKDRSYAHAFAFDNPSQPRKTYSVTDASLEFSNIPVGGRPWWIELDYRNADSNDLRYNYDRFMLVAGTDWDL